jgi:hypothetical protein
VDFTNFKIRFKEWSPEFKKELESISIFSDFKLPDPNIYIPENFCTFLLDGDDVEENAFSVNFVLLIAEYVRTELTLYFLG